MNDDTRIAGGSWKYAKYKAIAEDYAEKSWFINLTEDEKNLIIVLRKVQSRNP